MCAGVACLDLKGSVLRYIPLGLRQEFQLFSCKPMRVLQVDSELLCDDRYTGVGIINNDCPDINLAGTYAKDGFAVEKLVNVYDAYFFASSVIGTTRFIGYPNTKSLCFLYDLLR